MRFFWKLLLVVIPIGSYWLYKKGSENSSGNTKEEPRQAKSDKTTSAKEKQAKVSPKKKGRSAQDKNKEPSREQIIERLTDIEGVTSRVAKNLVERGITSKEALLKLSEEELKSIKGIGPKRAAKILNLG